MTKESGNCQCVCHSSANSNSPNVLLVQNNPNGDSPNVKSPNVKSPLGYTKQAWTNKYSPLGIEIITKDTADQGIAGLNQIIYSSGVRDRIFGT